MNVVCLLGRLTANPEMRQTPNGISVCSFSIAVDRYGGEEKKTDFINCVAWRTTAENIARFFRKGNRIGIKGSIQTRQYQDRETGKNRTAFEVLVDGFDFCEKMEDSNQYSGNYSAPNQYQQPAGGYSAPAQNYSAPQQGYSVPQYQQPTTQQWANPRQNINIDPVPQQQTFAQRPQQSRFAPQPQRTGFSTAALDGFAPIASDDGDLPFSHGAGI